MGNKRWRLVAALAAACLFSLEAHADYVTPAVGGSGGNQSYDLDCGAGYVLVGFTARWGFVMDSLGIICRKVNSDGTLGNAITRGPVGGGGGSNVDNPSCPGTHVVQQLWTYAGTYFDGTDFICSPWSPATRTVAQPPESVPDGDMIHIGGDGGTLSRLACPPDGRPATGIRGRYGSFVDSLALVCDSVSPPASGGGAPAQSGVSAGGGAGASAGAGAAPAKGGDAASAGAGGSAPSAAAGGVAPGAAAGIVGVAAQPGFAPGAAVAAATVIKFDQAPPAGWLLGFSASRGGQTLVRASGGTAPLTMTLSVIDSTYRAFFELAPPPATDLAATQLSTAGKLAPQTASITRILRMKPGTPVMERRGVVTIPMALIVRNSNGASAVRSIVVQLQP